MAQTFALLDKQENINKGKYFIVLLIGHREEDCISHKISKVNKEAEMIVDITFPTSINF